MLVIYAFVALCSLAGISANCKEIETMHYLDQSQFMGTWYENGMLDKRMDSCVKLDWFTEPYGQLRINVSAFNLNSNKMVEHTLELEKPLRSHPARFSIPYSTLSYNNRWILGTDYTSYSVEYSCNYYMTQIHIMTRRIKPPQSVIDEAMKVIKEHGITINKYATTDQTCWKPEEPEPSKPSCNFEIELTI